MRGFGSRHNRDVLTALSGLPLPNFDGNFRFLLNRRSGAASTMFWFPQSLGLVVLFPRFVGYQLGVVGRPSG